MTMPENRLKIGVMIIAVLVVANIIFHIIGNWGLITVKVTDAPLGQVIKSIERQGWVTIYSNIDPQTKISMYVDHVPLAEAMATLAVNANPAPVPSATGAATGSGRGGGGFGGEAQWHLAFFVAPTSAQVKEEIRTFTESADRDDDNTRIYSFPSPLDMVSNESTPAADPRLQIWPGLITPPPAPPLPADPIIPAPEPYVAPTTVQGYLRAFASAADVWIMTPASWDTPVTNPPPASSSIIGAIKHFVSSAHGSVTQAIILRGRTPRVAGTVRPRGEGFRGAGLDIGMMQQRMENVLNGLPESERPAVRDQMQKEVQFQKEVLIAPPERRRQLWMQHMVERRLESDNSFRRSPEKRAQMYSRLVSNRVAAQGK